MNTGSPAAAPTLRPSRCLRRWLEPIRSGAGELTALDWDGLERFESALRDMTGHPVLAAQDQRSRADALLAVRRRLVCSGDAESPAATDPTSGAEDLRQTLRQFICGYYDLDLRDASGPGHGRMILRHGAPACRERWTPRLAAGELAGVAMTEAVGGSQVHAISTTLTPTITGGWRLTGEKTWISRLAEASVFVVFTRIPDDHIADNRSPHDRVTGGAGDRVAGGRIAAVVVDAADPRIQRFPHMPSGLAGWTWGRLLLDGVPIGPEDVLTQPGFDGLALFHEHFTYYRPLVAATALGAAAAAHDTVAAHLAGREQRGEIGRVRDHALITLGRAHAQINSGLLAVLHTQRLAAAGHPDASLWARSTKAHGVDLARHATDELSVLVGAVGFTADHHLQKARRDLDALRYADGMHDSLNRSVGRALLNSRASAVPAQRSNSHPHPDTEGPVPDGTAVPQLPAHHPRGDRLDTGRSRTATAHS